MVVFCVFQRAHPKSSWLVRDCSSEFLPEVRPRTSSIEWQAGLSPFPLDLILGGIFFSASLSLSLSGYIWMAANDRNVLIHPSFSKNISLSCSVYDGLGIVLAMTRVQKSVHVADKHPLLRLVC